MNLLLSTGAIKGHSIDQTFRVARCLDLDGIELIIPNINWQPNISEINTLSERYNQKIYNIHMPFFQPAMLKYLINPPKFALKGLKNSIMIAKELKAKNLIIHPFPAFVFKDRIKRMMQDILAENKEKNISFSIENLEVRNLYFFKIEPYCIYNYQKLYDFVEENNFNITLDISHCMSKKIKPDIFFENFHDRINNIHLSDYEDYQCHYPLGTKTIDFDSFFRILEEYKYSGCLTLEINPTDEETVKQNIEYIRSYII